MNFKDYYKILEVEKTASQDEVKKSFRKLAAKYHPDKQGGDESKFKDISEAYEVLGDKQKRTKYDNLGSSYENFRSGGGSSADFDWSNWYSGGRNRKSGKTVSDFFNQGGSMSDFFDKIFGQTYSKQGAYGNTGSAYQEPYDNSSYGFEEKVDGKDFTKDLTISIQDAFKGIKKRLKVNGESIEVNIKPGIKDKQVLKIPKKGYKGKFGGKDGDLLINVNIQDDDRVERINNDLHITSDINIYEALLGGEKKIETFVGKFNLKIAPNTQQGKKLKLSNQGMPLYNNNDIRGDLYIKFNILMPEKLTDKQRDLLIKMKDAE
jgi:curved DNA-binding protein